MNPAAPISRGGMRAIGRSAFPRTPQRQFTTSTPFTQSSLSSLRQSTPRRPLPSSRTANSQSSKESLLRRLLTRKFSSTKWRRIKQTGSSGPPPPGKEDNSLSGKMKRLSREYGWSALGVYLALSALDFPFCYLLVRTLGTDRIGEWEHIVTSHISALIPQSLKDSYTSWRAAMKGIDPETARNLDIATSNIEDAEREANKSEASLATQLALAYAIHKSFIFVRVPLTAAVTPKIVQVLRGWGWNIGKRTTAAEREVRKVRELQRVAAKKEAKVARKEAKKEAKKVK